VERCLAEEAQALRLVRRAGQGVHSVVEAVLGLGDPPEQRADVDQSPRVAERRQELHGLGGIPGRGRGVAEHLEP
jgi:hypothetical protein